MVGVRLALDADLLTAVPLPEGAWPAVEAALRELVVTSDADVVRAAAGGGPVEAAAGACFVVLGAGVCADGDFLLFLLAGDGEYRHGHGAAARDHLDRVNDLDERFEKNLCEGFLEGCDVEEAVWASTLLEVEGGGDADENGAADCRELGDAQGAHFSTAALGLLCVSGSKGKRGSVGGGVDLSVGQSACESIAGNHAGS